MSGMPSRFLQEVHQHPPKVDRGLVADLAAGPIQTRRRDDGVNPAPNVAVGPDGGGQRVPRVHPRRRDVDVRTGEAPQHPEQFRAGQMLRQPQQRRATPDEFSPRRVIVEPGHRAEEGFTLIAEQRRQCRALVAFHPKRFLIWLSSVLEDGGIKIDSVASSITTLSARDMIEALIGGERDPRVLAELAEMGAAALQYPGSGVRTNREAVRICASWVRDAQRHRDGDH